MTWIVGLTFLFGWYRKWGGWTSNAFTATAALAMLLPIALLLWVGSGLSASEHIRRMFRVRVYVLAMCVRMLMLLQMLAVLTLMAKYGVALRDYPRQVTGWLLAPATAHHGGLDLPDYLVSSPGAAAFLVAGRRRRLRGLPVVDVLSG